MCLLKNRIIFIQIYNKKVTYEFVVKISAEKEDNIMNANDIFNKMNSYLESAKEELSGWLYEILPRTTKNWWEDCVIANLSYNQRDAMTKNNYDNLSDFDISVLLKVTDKNWYEIKNYLYLSSKERECIKDMIHVRNNWIHVSNILPGKDIIISDLNTLSSFFEIINSSANILQDIVSFIQTIEAEKLEDLSDEESFVLNVADVKIDSNISISSVVYPVGTPDKKGIVTSIDTVGTTKKYTVFIDGAFKVFLEGQIASISETDSYNWVDVTKFRSLLTAYQINNPSVQNLYSLNSARIDFVPYQFRPALKMIHSDEPRILIADSVGVGKTIEAGLIIKELDARNSLENIMIICPKPLVTEHKWETEMKRFDEDFVELDGSALRQAISDTDRDGEWPVRYNKTIVPYSILDSKTYEGDKNGLHHSVGLDDLDPAPHFDLVIIDEAHHIRNGSMEKEKAFAYKCCKYFCDHSDAVVMLTATPLQTSDNDLFVLLNMLRPDIVIDKSTFDMMSRPNAYISKCSALARSAETEWKEQVIEALKELTKTQWGENVTAKNPAYTEALNILTNSSVTREERVKVISLIESLHSFNDMLNRTRRKDIQDFCIRRSYTVEVEFTEIQMQIHNMLLDFERNALSALHNERSVPFMMSSIRRQAASCIFGLAPHIKDVINRRFGQMYDDPTIDFTIEELSEKSGDYFYRLAYDILQMAENLPDEDPKYDGMLKVIKKKQEVENNKIIIFSTYKHTLNYLSKKLINNGYRVAVINGDVKDDERMMLRKRFELNRNDENALDILLFTEVGSEGLDYQFCDMMINYDLPWNPMRIEQRIGRIDRRGQKSETVSIYNLITKDTIDADIYYRCLLRIGVFESSIGECEEIIGEIGAKIEEIAIDSRLTDAERRIKLEQMADNEVRKIQEINRLEDEEKELFAFDLSNSAMSQEVQNAESPWLSAKCIQIMIESYLNDVLGKGTYIIGESDTKTIRLNAANRAKLKEIFTLLPGQRNSVRKKWELYLKGNKPTHSITFDSETADKDSNAFFITSMHPLAKQAAKHFMTDKNVYFSFKYASDDLPKGIYAFSVFAWNYLGHNEHFQLVTACENDKINAELPDILQYVQNSSKVSIDGNRWIALEDNIIENLRKERENHIASAKSAANYKAESLTNNYRNRKRMLETNIRDASDEHIKRMRRSELETAREFFETKIAEIQKATLQADIHMSEIAKGVIEII